MSEQNNSNQLPDWQEFQNQLIAKALSDENFRAELISDPKAVVEKEMGKLKEGAKLPAGLEVKLIEQPADTLYLILPTMSGELSDEALDEVAGGGSMGFCINGQYNMQLTKTK
jgi:hypothetical protein